MLRAEYSKVLENGVTEMRTFQFRNAEVEAAKDI